MEWAIGVFLVAMLGLFVWSNATAGRQIGKKIQPFVDELLGVAPPGEGESKNHPPGNPKGH